MTEIDQNDDISTIDIKPSIVEGGDAERTYGVPKILLLIQLIANEPAIFNIKHEDHRNVFKKDEQWKMFSKEIGWTVKHCKSKWKALRDQYCRELKRARNNSKIVIKWKYFHHLEFLRPFALSRNYRPKTSTASEDGDRLLGQEDEPSVEEVEKNEKCSFPIKSENWNSYNGDETTTIQSEITDPTLGKVESDAIMDDDPPDDEDDDPIHTFLNIESYFEKELITMVQTEEVLYNQQHPSYKNISLKKVVWGEIARKLKRTVRQCRLKWKALRNQYIREHKRLLRVRNVKSSARWKHYDALSFLKNFLRQKSEHYQQLETESTQADMSFTDTEQENVRSVDNNCEIFGETHINQESDQQTNEQMDITTPIEPTPVTPNPTPTESAPTDDNDEIGAFFRAIAMKIRKAQMSTMAFTELQIDILRVITNALRGHT